MPRAPSPGAKTERHRDKKSTSIAPILSELAADADRLLPADQVPQIAAAKREDVPHTRS
jgi:hypothetical protein